MSFQVPIDPSAVLPYGCDWTAWLGTTSIVTSTWTITPAGPVLASSSYLDGETVVWVSGCTNGVTYTLTNRITTDGTPARVDERSIVLVCRER